MQLSLQSIQAKINNLKASMLIKARQGRGRYVFVQTPEQARALKKGTLTIVYGDATLAQIRKAKKDAASPSELDGEFYIQPMRYPNDQIASLLGKANESLNVQLRRSVIDAANEAGAKVVGVGLDGVVARGLRESKPTKNVVMIIIHHVPDKAFYLLEQWLFRKGKLHKLEELNISARSFDNPITDIASAIANLRSQSSTSGHDIKISGVHGFTNRDAVQILASAQAIADDDGLFDAHNLDEPLGLFNKRFGNIEFLDFDSFTFPSPPIVTDEKAKVKPLTPAVIVIAGIGAYYGLSEMGRVDYKEAVEAHGQAVRQIQSVYAHGSAPISLVQSRQYFMEDHSLKTPVFHDAIASIFAAVSEVHDSHPGAQARFENLAYNPDGLGGALGANNFELTVSYHAVNNQAVLTTGYQIHQSLASSLNASTQTKDLPRSSGGEGARYNLTISGEFR